MGAMSALPPPNEAARPDESGGLLATADLLRLAKAGDPHAQEQLFARYLPRLRRWAAGRLPAYARSLLDTSDLVQDVLMRVLQGMDNIEVRGPGGFQAYVRQAVLNRIRDEVRWASRRPGPDGVPETIADPSPSPIESAIGRDTLDRYEQALASLGDEDRQLIHLRIELDFDYAQIAGMTGRPSPDAARVATQRALGRLAGAMGHPRR